MVPPPPLRLADPCFSCAAFRSQLENTWPQMAVMTGKWAVRNLGARSPSGQLRTGCSRVLHLGVPVLSLSNTLAMGQVSCTAPYLTRVHNAHSSFDFRPRCAHHQNHTVMPCCCSDAMPVCPSLAGPAARGQSPSFICHAQCSDKCLT